jgi:hypothetical protein
LKGGQCLSSGQESGQQELQPFEQEVEVVAGCGEQGVKGIASTMREIIAGHAVFGLEMTDHGFDGGAPSELAFDLGRKPATGLTYRP